MSYLSETRAVRLKRKKLHRPKAVEVGNPDCVLLYRFERVGEGLPVGGSYSGYVVPTYSRL
jgi:hypothetical protein